MGEFPESECEYYGGVAAIVWEVAEYDCGSAGDSVCVEAVFLGAAPLRSRFSW